MLKNIYKLLPYFIVEKLAQRFAERVDISGMKAYTVFEDSYIIKK